MAPVSRARAKAGLNESGPKTRARKKESEKPLKNANKKKASERRRSHDSMVGSSDETKKTKKKSQKKIKDSDDDDSAGTDKSEDQQYVIVNKRLRKKYKIRYYDEFGIEDVSFGIVK